MINPPCVLGTPERFVAAWANSWAIQGWTEFPRVGLIGLMWQSICAFVVFPADTIHIVRHRHETHTYRTVIHTLEHESLHQAMDRLGLYVSSKAFDRRCRIRRRLVP